jgi:hypothetical protein
VGSKRDRNRGKKPNILTEVWNDREIYVGLFSITIPKGIYTVQCMYMYIFHVRWVTCDHGLAVADGGDALQVWRVTADILNKQSRAADKGWSSSWGVGRGSINSSP